MRPGFSNPVAVRADRRLVVAALTARRLDRSACATAGWEPARAPAARSSPCPPKRRPLTAGRVAERCGDALALAAEAGFTCPSGPDPGGCRVARGRHGGRRRGAPR